MSKVQRQKEINLEFIVNYSSLIRSLRIAMVELESNGIAAFLNDFDVVDVTDFKTKIKAKIAEVDVIKNAGQLPIPAEPVKFTQLKTIEGEDI